MIRILFLWRLSRLACWLGLHRWDKSEAIYTVRCSRCGRQEYVGP